MAMLVVTLVGVATGVVALGRSTASVVQVACGHREPTDGAQAVKHEAADGAYGRATSVPSLAASDDIGSAAGTIGKRDGAQPEGRDGAASAVTSAVQVVPGLPGIRRNGMPFPVAYAAGARSDVSMTAADGTDMDDDFCKARMDWPIERTADGQGDVVEPFDAPDEPWLPGHRGVDIAAESGTPIHAPCDAAVRFAGRVAGKDVLSLEGGGMVLTFEPAASDVAVGETVERGQLIGTVAGDSDHCSDQCVHWGLRYGRNDYRNPVPYASDGVIALKPT